MTKKLSELSEDELKEINGGIAHVMPRECPAFSCPYNSKYKCPHINYGCDRISDCKYN